MSDLTSQPQTSPPWSSHHGAELLWFTSYLENRKPATCYNQCLSDLPNLHMGVPQGSVLGSFFSVYKLFTYACLEYSQIRLYADDTTLSFSSKSSVDISTMP